MKKFMIVLAIGAATAFSATPAFVQETDKPHPQHEQGTPGAGGMMHEGSMMCPMMSSGNMGMMGLSGMSSDPKVMGRVMQMRGEMMIRTGEVMMKHGKQMLNQK